MNDENDLECLKTFLDKDGRIIALPSKCKKKLAVIWYLATKIEDTRHYTEREINDLLNGWTVFRDAATLRRELYENKLLDRTRDCRLYQKAEEIPPLEQFIEAALCKF